MYPLKQSTSVSVPFFAHDENGDAVTGLTDGSFTKRLSKGSGAFGAMTATITELENGWYLLPLSAAHTDTLGILSITLTNAGCKQVNLQFRITATLADDEHTANITSIGGSATAASNLSASALGIFPSSVNDASPSNTAFVIVSTESTNDHYKGRIIVFTTGALANQATDITAYDGATKTVTVTALTEAPADGDDFVII